MGIRRKLRDDVTYWPLVVEDTYGGFTFGTPVKLKGRWQEMATLFRSADGEEETSQAVVYIEQQVAIGDYIAFGDLTTTVDPTTIADTFRIRQFGRSTDLRSASELYKAFL